MANNYGLIITLPGYSAWDATMNQIVFISDKNIYKTILDKSGFATGGYWDSTTISHEQPEVPAFLAFRELDTTTGRFSRQGGTSDFDPFSLNWGSIPYIDGTNLVTYGNSAYFIFLERRV